MPTLSVRPQSQSQFTVTTTIFPGTYFTKFSGLNDTSENVTYPDGLEFKKFYVLGLATLQAMSIEIPHSPVLHEELLLFKRNNPCTSFVLAITPVNCDGTEIQSSVNTTLFLTGCQLTGVTAYQVDRNAAAISMIKLDFVADDYFLG